MNREKLLVKMLEAHKRCNNLLRDVLEINYDREKEYVVTVSKMMDFMSARISSTLSLVQVNFLWDAEIISRSIAECALKLIYVSIFEKEERDKRIIEFWNDHSEINSLKTTKIARETINILEKLNAKDIIIMFEAMKLDEEKEIKLRDKWTIKAKRQFEQKWSFFEMINAISKKIEYMEIVQLFLFTYMRSSHLIHADETGIILIEERMSRSPKDIEIVENSHFCDLLRKTFELRIISCLSVDLALGNKGSAFKQLYEDLKDIYFELQQAMDKILENDVYDQYRK